jgi:hypothetical protein
VTTKERRYLGLGSHQIAILRRLVDLPGSSVTDLEGDQDRRVQTNIALNRMKAKGLVRARTAINGHSRRHEYRWWICKDGLTILRALELIK